MELIAIHGTRFVERSLILGVDVDEGTSVPLMVAALRCMAQAACRFRFGV